MRIFITVIVKKREILYKAVSLASISKRWQFNSLLTIRAVTMAKGFIAVRVQRTVTRFVTVV